MEIKLTWKHAQKEYDTKTMELVSVPARGERLFGPDELDADLCINDGMMLGIANIHLGNKDSSNALCEEICRRFNEFPEELKK